MSSNGVIIFISITLICVLVYTLFLSKSAVIQSIIKKQPKKKISEVKDGEVVTIVGKVVHAGRTITAPFSKRTCVYYYVTVLDSSAQRDTFKNYIDLKEERVADVVICDGENYAVIDTKALASYVNEDVSQSSGFWNLTSDELKAFLKKHGERTENYLGWSLDLTATEGVWEEGERVAVAGKASWRNASDFKIKVPVKKVLYLTGLNEHGVYVTDDTFWLE